MAADHVYHWKHGWIPLNAAAAHEVERRMGNRSADKVVSQANLASLKAAADKLGPGSKAHAEYHAALKAHAEKMGPHSKAAADYKAATSEHVAHAVTKAPAHEVTAHAEANSPHTGHAAKPASSAEKIAAKAQPSSNKAFLQGLSAKKAASTPKAAPPKPQSSAEKIAAKATQPAAAPKATVPPVKAKPRAVNAAEKKASLEGLSGQQVKSLKAYTGSAYKPINNGLRDGKVPAKYKADIEAIDAALASKKFTEPVKVYRTVGGGAFGLSHGSSPAELKGKIFTEHGFMSTSTTNQRFPVSPPPVHITMEVPPGIGGAYVDPISKFQGENEMLLPRGMRYAITNVRYSSKHGGWTATARILPAA